MGSIRRQFGCYAQAAVAMLLLAQPGQAAELPGLVETWDTVPYRPYDVVVLADGSPWFTADDSVFTIDPATGAVSAYTLIVPPMAATPQFWTLAVDGDGILWIADGADRLVRFDPVTHAFTALDLPTPLFTLPASPFGVEVAADGAIWFTCQTDRSLGRYDPVGGMFQRFAPMGDLPAPPVEIAFDAAGLVYFTLRSESGSPAGLGRYDPVLDTFDFWLNPYTGVTSPFGIVRVGTQFWFLDHHAGRLVRFDPGDETFHPIPTPPELFDPHLLVADPAGRLWFTAYGTSRLGRFDPATSSFLWADMPSTDAHPIGIARSADGTVWWAQTGRQRTDIGVGVGRYTVARPQVAPALDALGLLGAAGVLTAIGLAALRRARRRADAVIPGR